jgi:hypothetical protein
MAGRSKARASSAVSPPSRRPQQVTALPPGHHCAGGRLRVDSHLDPGVGRPGAQLYGEVGEEHQLAGCPVGVAGQQLVQHGAVRLGDSRVQQGGRRQHQHAGWLGLAGRVQK